MNLLDLYEMRDPRDAYKRDVANSTSGFGKDSQAYRADGGANDESHGLDQQSSTWYIRLNGKLIKDKSGNPYAFQDKAAANKAARTMQAKLFNKDKEFMLTTNPNDKVAEGSQRVDSLITDALKIMQGATMNDAVAALKTVLGNREYNDRRGHYNFYVRQLMDMYGQQGVTEAQQLSVQQLATISDAALDKAYGYGRSQPGNSFGWQANLKSAAFAKQMIDKGVTDIEAISDAIHKGWNTTAQAFVQNPEQFDDTAKLKAAGKLEAKLQQRAQLMKQNYGQLPEEEKEKDRVVARALLQALKGEQGVTEAEADSDGHSVDHADSGEYDYEGDQARDQMNTIVRAARRLDGLLDDNENMPEWVQMKVTLAADYLDTAADYIESNQDPKLDDIFEADEWEENTEKWDRFKKWAIDQMMRSTEKVGTGNHVSKLENQYFDHPINVGPSNTSQQPFGTVTTNIGANKKWTEFVQSIIDNYENYEAEWKADSAASLIDNPEYKKFLDRAYTDFMGMGKNTTEQREQHAMALSGYQVKHFGGKLFGSLFGNIRGARASMTPEVYGALEKSEYDLEQKKITDWDDERRAEQLKFWQMLPYPIKLMVAAGMGKTPAQVEAILSTSGKSDNEIMGAYIDASNVPGYTPGQQQQQRPPMNEPPRLESDRGRGRPPAGEQDTTPVIPGRVEKTATGIRHHADASRYGGTEPDAEDDYLMSKSHISRLGKMTEPDIDEGWRETLGAAALTGAMALGAGGAQARVMPGDDPNINRLTGKPVATQQATDVAPAKAEAPKGFSKEYLQKAANPDRFGRYMISVEKAQELLKQTNEGEKVGNMDADKFDAAMARLKQLAGAGPMKTVYDPTKRVYRNVPVAVQPKK